MLLNLPDFVRTLLRLPSRPDKVEPPQKVNMFFAESEKDDQVPKAMGRRSFFDRCRRSGRRACLRISSKK